MERCSIPRRGLEAPDPIDLIFKEKWGLGGIATKRVRAVARTDATNCHVLLCLASSVRKAQIRPTCLVSHSFSLR